MLVINYFQLPQKKVWFCIYDICSFVSILYLFFSLTSFVFCFSICQKGFGFEWGEKGMVLQRQKAKYG